MISGAFVKGQARKKNLPSEVSPAKVERTNLGVATEAIRPNAKKSSARTYLLFLSLLIALGSCFHLLLRVPPDIIWGNEIPHHMDSAWRIAQGQIPHVDFYIHAYELYHFVIALFLIITGPQIAAVTFARIFFMVTLSLSAWIIARNRFSPAWSFSIAALILVLVAGYYPLGYEFRVLTHSEFANRLGWAVLTITLLYTFFPATSRKGLGSDFESWLAGILLASALFIKPSYFLEGFCAYLLGFYHQVLNRRQVGFAILGSLCIALAYSLFIRWQWGAYIHSTFGLFHTFDFKFSDIALKALSIVPFLFLLPLALSFAKRASASSIEIQKLFHFYLFVVLGAFGVLLTNLPQQAECASFMILPLLALRYVKSVKSSWVAMLLLATCGGWVIQSVLSIHDGLFAEQELLKMPARELANYSINSPSYSGWVSISGGGPCQGDAWVARVNEGLELVKKNTASTDKVTTLDYMNIYPFALNRPSPKGGYTVLHFGLNVDEAHYPDPKVLLGDTDVVMIPRKCPENTAAPFLAEKYSAFLEENFPETVKSDNWILRKKIGS